MTDMLTNMLPYLDKHLALGLLSFYAEKGHNVQDASEKVLLKTGRGLDFNVKPEHEEKQQALTQVAKPALDAFFQASSDEDYTYQFKLGVSEAKAMHDEGELSQESLRGKYGISQEVMRAVQQLAHIYYDKGSYGDAAELLTFCQYVSGYDLPTNMLLWGKLMCDTGACNWQSAIDVAASIRHEQNSKDDEIFRGAQAATVRARAWLLHWVLFPFFKGGLQYSIQVLYYIFDAKSNFIYQSVVETVCPHYIRYICAAAIIHYTRHQNFRSTATMAEEIYEYSDPLTQLVQCIHKQAFEDALALLPAVRETTDGDYFLCDHTESIITNAQKAIFQRYMALHCVVSIPYVATRLNMSKEDADVWLVNLIKDSKQHAKIDSVNEQLIVEPQTRSVENLVYDKIEAASRK